MLQYNNITNIIAELLFKHDCVIVPNFGGFVARDYVSGFNKGNNILYPPSKQILFNKNLVHNDGLLAAAVMHNNGISSSESAKLLTDYKDYIDSLLSVKRRFELNNIGLLYIDSENTLRFEAKADVNFLLDSFGFEPVIASELIIEAEKPVATKQFEDRKITTEVVVPKKRSYAKIAALAVALPVTVAFLLFAASLKPMEPILQSSINPFYSPEKTYTPQKINSGKAIYIASAEKSNLVVDANGFATIKLSDNGPVLIANINGNEAVADKTNVRHVAKVNRKNQAFDGNYQVVVGCFGVEKNAAKLVKELEAKNLNAGISGLNNKGLHVVSCGGFTTKEEATQMLLSVKAELPNAWIMAK